jgi:hypothetical protein
MAVILSPPPLSGASVVVSRAPYAVSAPALLYRTPVAGPFIAVAQHLNRAAVPLLLRLTVANPGPLPVLLWQDGAARSGPDAWAALGAWARPLPRRPRYLAPGRSVSVSQEVRPGAVGVVALAAVDRLPGPWRILPLAPPLVVTAAAAARGATRSAAGAATAGGERGTFPAPVTPTRRLSLGACRRRAVAVAPPLALGVDQDAGRLVADRAGLARRSAWVLSAHPACAYLVRLRGRAGASLGWAAGGASVWRTTRGARPVTVTRLPATSRRVRVRLFGPVGGAGVHVSLTPQRAARPATAPAPGPTSPRP